MTPVNSRLFGYTRLEIGFTVLLITFVLLFSIIKYRDTSIMAREAVEGGVIKGVRASIADYAQYAHSHNITPIYPRTLGNAEIGDAIPRNRIFNIVLEKGGIAVEGWAKVGDLEYRTPSGKRYVYNPETGEFQEDNPS